MVVPFQKVKVEYSENGSWPLLTSLVLTVDDQEKRANFGLLRIDGAFVWCKFPHDLVPFLRALFYGFAIDIFVCIVRFILDSFWYYLSFKSLEIFIRRPELFLLGLFVMEEGSLKRSHVPTFDSPGKPDSKRRSQESSCNTDTPRARRSIAHAFASSPKLSSSIPKSRSPSQRVMQILYLVFLSIFYLLK